MSERDKGDVTAFSGQDRGMSAGGIPLFSALSTIGA